MDHILENAILSYLPHFGYIKCTYNFVEKQLAALLLAQVHHLDGNAAARARVHGRAHHARAALADLAEAGQRRARVARADNQPERCAKLGEDRFDTLI